MRLRNLRTLGIGAVALVTAATVTSGADATARPRVVGAQSMHTQASLPGAAGTCYTQRDHDAFNGVLSQNFEPMFDAYDAQAADDFVLRKPCRHPVITFDGSYGEGVEPPDTFNVTIYRSTRHAPGKIERYLDAVPYTGDCGQWVCGTIVLGKKLRPGHWWVAVQANYSFTESSGLWTWLTNVKVRRTASMWENPRDGFGTGCTTYTDMISCLGSDKGLGGDVSFSIGSS